MSAGIPVVASRVGGLPEAVVDGETGLLVDDDGEAAITRLLGDEQLAARLGRAGRERYRAMFTVDRMVEATLAVYREVVG
jgi:glycosyltransferase involved in cell wall biosynthesis